MLKIVLVRPKYPRNIGMVARAIANYGDYNLILINPQCELDVEAHEGAARGQEPLENVEIYDTWEKFYDREPEGLRIAFTRRTGKRRESEEFSETLKNEPDLISANNKRWVYLIFGPEDHGLADEDLDFVHRILHFEMPGKVKSLNLSHAVLTALTLLHTHKVSLQAKEDLIEEPFYFPEKTLKKWLETLNFDLTTHRRVNAYTVLRNMLLKSVPNTKELHILEAALQQTIRKLKEKRTLKKDNLDLHL